MGSLSLRRAVRGQRTKMSQIPRRHAAHIAFHQRRLISTVSINMKTQSDFLMTSAPETQLPAGRSKSTGENSKFKSHINISLEPMGRRPRCMGVDASATQVYMKVESGEQN